MSTGKGNGGDSSVAGKTAEADSENHYSNLKSRRMARQSGQVPCPESKNQRFLSVLLKEKMHVHSGKSLASGTESALASLVSVSPISFPHQFRAEQMK